MRILSCFTALFPQPPRTTSRVLTIATLIVGCALVIIGVLALILTKQIFPLVLCAAGGACMGIVWIKRALLKPRAT